jgi:hypothetical protein
MEINSVKLQIIRQMFTYANFIMYLMHIHSIDMTRFVGWIARIIITTSLYSVSVNSVSMVPYHDSKRFPQCLKEIPRISHYLNAPT